VAIALGQSDISLGDVWAATRRNTWRMALGPLACIILLGIPGAIMFHLNGMNRLSAAAVLTLLDLISIIGGVVGVSFLSLAYRHFFPMKPYIRMQAVVAPV
jgi:predicted lipid-binding transport protein (Tim44 family)